MRLANAPPPLFFVRRGVRLQSFALTNVRERSAEQRPFSSHALRRGRPDRRTRAARRSTAATLHPGAVLPGTDGGQSAHLIPQAFARVPPSRVQPERGQTHVVGSDGYPRRPGPVRARHKRGRRILSRCHDAS